MFIRKLAVVILVLVMAALVITACGADTADDVQQAVEEAAAEIEQAVTEAAPTIEAAATQVVEAIEEALLPITLPRHNSWNK